jgi:SpoVK/Ycf46/Vps4 family AAA+-type ATPase
MKSDVAKRLTNYIKTKSPIIYINNFDFTLVDRMIKLCIEKASVKHVVEYDCAIGAVNFVNKVKAYDVKRLDEFLEQEEQEGFNQQSVIVLKEVNKHFEDDRVIAFLRRIVEKDAINQKYKGVTVIIVSSFFALPRELENYISIIQIPLPNQLEIKNVIEKFVVSKLPKALSNNELDKLAFSLKGFNEFQIRQLLSLEFQLNNAITFEFENLINREKESYVKKVGNIEIIDFKESIEQIGGLKTLKEWLLRKQQLYSQLVKATQYNIELPKGVIITGVPGCGKSLTAKVTASVLKMPLLRLDIGKVLGKYVGESEGNFKRSLSIAEAISPCVLWVDEIEKAFVGVGGDSSNEVTTRLFGQFLTWLQEHTAPVFVIATANSIDKLPVEFLRKGRFDEIFFVDLPTEYEREQIFDLQLKRQGKLFANLNIDIRNTNTKQYAQMAVNFSGADIEAVIKKLSEDVFVDGIKSINTHILKLIEDTHPSSEIMWNNINDMRKKAKEMGLTSASGVPIEYKTDDNSPQKKLERLEDDHNAKRIEFLEKEIEVYAKRIKEYQDILERK